MRDAVLTETLAKPTVAAVCDEFVQHGRNLARVLGHPNLNILILPYPLEGRSAEELAKIAGDFYPRLLDMLGALR